MKRIDLSKSQIYFGLCTMFISSIFFRSLYDAIENQAFQNIAYTAGIYGAVMFFNGLFFGYKDDSTAGAELLGFRYHLMTFIIVNAMGIPWFLLSLDFSKEYLWVIFAQLGAWSVGLLLHWLLTLRLIRNTQQ